MIEIFSNLDELNFFAAGKFIACGNAAIEQSGKFTVALAGGSTPKSLYRLLTTDKFSAQIDWQKVFFFFGDERNVSIDSDESNFRMANENLLKPLQILTANIFRWQIELEDAKEIAENYEKTIKKFFDLKNYPSADADGSDRLQFPRFDLILLGMGDDGHTASLFPFSKALRETRRIATANYVEKLDTNRLTFTFPTINNASNVIFLIGGAAKAYALKEVLEGKAQPKKFPSQNVNPTDGNLFRLVDRQAAQLLR